MINVKMEIMKEEYKEEYKDGVYCSRCDCCKREIIVGEKILFFGGKAPSILNFQYCYDCGKKLYFEFRVAFEPKLQILK